MATDGGAGSQAPPRRPETSAERVEGEQMDGWTVPFPPGSTCSTPTSVLSGKRARCGKCITDTCSCRLLAGDPSEDSDLKKKALLLFHCGINAALSKHRRPLTS